MDSETKLVGLYSTEIFIQLQYKKHFLRCPKRKNVLKNVVSLIIKNVKKGTV